MKRNRSIAEAVQVDLLGHDMHLLQRDTVVGQNVQQYRHHFVVQRVHADHPILDRQHWNRDFHPGYASSGNMVVV